VRYGLIGSILFHIVIFGLVIFNFMSSGKNDGTPPVPGVSVSGGNTVVNLGSFGDGPAADPKLPARSSAKAQPQALGVTIVATANSGGAFEPYKNQLRGEKYTTYVAVPVKSSCATVYVVEVRSKEMSRTKAWRNFMTLPS